MHCLSQAELGALLGIEATKQSRISNYENGERAIPIGLAYKFIDLAKANGTWLTLEDVYPRPNPGGVR
jgi:transcriptional regulator with XRE-family HTH domain